MEQITAWAAANPLLAVIAYAVASALLNLLIAERSRVDAWCERHPYLAIPLKTLRAVGVDPWHLIAAASLAVNKRLPAASQRSTSLPRIPPVPLLVLAALLLGGCAAAKPYVATVNQAAQILCESSPDAVRQAEARGISVEQLCQLHEVIAPFVDEATRAQARASRSARLVPETP